MKKQSPFIKTISMKRSSGSALVQSASCSCTIECLKGIQPFRYPAYIMND
ncbi:hypothetical protein B4100_0040 [Heyndrickxia coagulans]|nr:hypothetical protein B4100_0040 [Heyndrickxia coagulans]